VVTGVTSPAGRALPDPQFWHGRRVLLTGHTGFKGSWLTCWLRELGATVMGVALPELPTQPSLWEQLDIEDVIDVRGDIAGTDWMPQAIRFAPDVVLHLAAQSLVSVGHEEPARTYETNVMGTVRVLDLLAALENVIAALVITTDKVYDPSQSPPHNESHHFGGREPYSASKAAAEIVVAGWPSTGTALATARAGNVIGGGDWAANRLVPDLVRAWAADSTPMVRRPLAVRPWQHVLEPLRGYLLYVEALADNREVARGLNFGPSDQQSVSVAELVDHAASQWTRFGRPLPHPPWATGIEPGFAETATLTLDSALALTQLDWTSVLGWREAVTLTLDWYCRAGSGDSPPKLVAEQLTAYTSSLRSQP
jgi:CDP-glucose 4,6-dehydratase